MPAEGLTSDPMSYRYFDYPRPGSIFRLPDNPRLVRGPTYVKLPSGQDVQVPAQLKRSVIAPGQVHENDHAQNSMQQLLNLLSGKRGSDTPAGFKTGGKFDRPVQNPLLHPREGPRRCSIDNSTMVC